MPVRKLDTLLEIFGRDRTGAAFNSVGSRIGKLENRTRGMTTSIGTGFLGAQAITKGFELTLQAVGAGINSVTSALAESQSAQDSILASTSSVAAIAEISYDDAEASILRVRDALTESAKVLPGQTAEYAKLATSIFDNVIPAAKGLDGALQFDVLEDNVRSLSESYGALGKQAGIASADISKGVSRALQGKTLPELANLQLFEENPAILALLEKGLAERNVETLKDLDVSARLGLIREVGEKFITEEFKDAASETLSGIQESYRTVLFDPAVGIFGASRDLLSDIEGEQSVFTAYTALVKSIIGKGGLFSPDGPLVGLLEALGIDLPDPLLFVYEKTNQVTAFVERLKSGIEDFSSKFDNVDQVTSAIANFDVEVLGAKVASFGTELLRQGLETTNELIAKFDSAEVGLKIGKFLGAGAVTIFKEFPYDLMGDYLVKGTIAGLNLLTGAVIGAVGGVIDEIAKAITDFLKNVITAPLNNAFGNTKDNGSRLRAREQLGKGRQLPDSADTSKLFNRGRSGRRRTVQGAAMGFNPADLIAAAIAEDSAAPPGAGLVVANTTEQIIPANNQQRSPIPAAPSGGVSPSASTSTSPSAVTINFSPTLVLEPGSTRAQAEKLLAMIQNLMQEQLETQLV